jgi:hypothetical protein
VPASKLVDGSSVSCGCWEADPDVSQAARMTMPGAWRLRAWAAWRGTAIAGGARCPQIRQLAEVCGNAVRVLETI